MAARDGSDASHANRNHAIKKPRRPSSARPTRRSLTHHPRHKGPGSIYLARGQRIAPKAASKARATTRFVLIGELRDGTHYFSQVGIDVSVKTVIAFMISLYQKYISPRKGFRCAHASYHGGLSCSQAVKAIINKHGVWSGLFYSGQRFRDCRRAAIYLRSEREMKKKEEPGGCQEACDLGLDACDCASAIPGIVLGKRGQAQL